MIGEEGGRWIGFFGDPIAAGLWMLGAAFDRKLGWFGIGALVAMANRGSRLGFDRGAADSGRAELDAQTRANRIVAEQGNDEKAAGYSCFVGPRHSRSSIIAHECFVHIWASLLVPWLLRNVLRGGRDSRLSPPML